MARRYSVTLLIQIDGDGDFAPTFEFRPGTFMVSGGGEIAELVQRIVKATQGAKQQMMQTLGGEDGSD
jgi:hypothetical protein